MVLERSRQGSVEILKLNRPEQRNALSPELIAAITDALAEIETDDAVRCVVLTGAGDRAFCAGMDLKAFAASRSEAPAATEPEQPARREGGFFENFEKPVIGAINGTAVAGGFELMLHCDIAVASDAAKFGIAEVKRGLFAAGGGYTLPSRIPLALAMELGLTGELIDAETARQWGLVNRVVPFDDVLPTALKIAESVGANGPLAVRVTKKLMRATAEHGVDAARELARENQELVFGSKDALEGATAFAEKREPQWTGS